MNQDLVQEINPIPLVQDIDGKEVIQATIDIKQEIRNNPKIAIKGKSSRRNKIENGVCLPPLLPPQAADQVLADRIDRKRSRSKNRRGKRPNLNKDQDQRVKRGRNLSL